MADPKKTLTVRDRTRLGLARRAKEIFRAVSGRPQSTDDDESVRVVPRREGQSSPRTLRRPMFDPGDEE